MSDISNVLRKVIELDISLGLDGTQEALDEITRLTSEAAWARGAAEQAERQIEEAHKAIPAHCWRDPPKGRAWTIGEAITSLTAEVERLRSLTVVQESLIRKSEAANEKLRAALLDREIDAQLRCEKIIRLEEELSAAGCDHCRHWFDRAALEEGGDD